MHSKATTDDKQNNVSRAVHHGGARSRGRGCLTHHIRGIARCRGGVGDNAVVQASIWLVGGKEQARWINLELKAARRAGGSRSHSTATNMKRGGEALSG